jgi:hypothetical protein
MPLLIFGLVSLKNFGLCRLFQRLTTPGSRQESRPFPLVSNTPQTQSIENITRPVTNAE